MTPIVFIIEAIMTTLLKIKFQLFFISTVPTKTTINQPIRLIRLISIYLLSEPVLFSSQHGNWQTVMSESALNDATGATKEYPGFAGKPIGATGTLFIEVEGVNALHDRLKTSVKVVMPIETKFYGMREFAIEDPDGYVITFAERVKG